MSPPVTSSSLLGNVTRYEAVQNTAPRSSEEMGKQDFLTLFTAQLKNQNPLDPVKNEAFVAQLAQFSQLEALTNMQGSLNSFVSSMQGERLLNSSSLIGKKVAVSDAPVALADTGTVQANIKLPLGAGSVQMQVIDSHGMVVRELGAGAQTPGSLSLDWDGLDSDGDRAAPGLYQFKASGLVNGQRSALSIETLSTVRAIRSNAADGSVSVEVDGGRNVPLASITRVGA